MSYECGNLWRGRMPTVGAQIACAAALFSGLGGGVQAAEARQVTADGLDDCAPYTFNSPNGERRACIALIENAIGHVILGVPVGARAPYYAYGRTSYDRVKGGAKHHFETRYWPPARDNIEKEVESWPRGIKAVDNNIHLLALSVNQKANRTLAKTRESWQVVDIDDGTPRHSESGQIHYYTMCRVKLPSDPPFEIHLLPEWVVVKDSPYKKGRDPKFNCNAFAAKVKKGIIR
ncbi:hypothetical protein HYW35_00075 [Candidatus Saccharibacteria bacterium]|nr:hypothetical protein [Candidatus Saccharibacteria bacterium]